MNFFLKYISSLVVTLSALNCLAQKPDNSLNINNIPKTEMRSQDFDSMFNSQLKDSSSIKDSLMKFRRNKTIRVLDSITNIRQSLNRDSSRTIKPMTSILPEPKVLFANKFNELKSIVSSDLSTPQKSRQINGRLASLKRFAQIKTNGEVHMEGFVSNGTTPFQLHEQHYLRVYGNPGLTILGLPFQSDFYYTTEDNTFYNSNGFGLRFDPMAFRQQSVERLTKLLAQKKKQFVNLKSEQQKLDLYKADLKRQLRSQKSQLEKRKNELLKEIDEAYKYDPTFEANFKTPGIDPNINRDSLLHNQKDKFSLDSSRLNQLLDYYNTVKSLEEKLNQYQSYLQQVKKYEEKYDGLESQYESLIQSKENLLNKQIQSSKTDLNGKISSSTVMKKVHALDIGIHQPYYSDHSIDGIPVKGVNIIFDNNYQIQFTAGRTMSSFSSFESLNSSAQTFNRNVIGAKFDIKPLKFGSVYLLAAGLWDPRQNNNGNIPRSNVVSGIGAHWTLLGKVELEGEVLGSYVNNGLVRDFSGFETSQRFVVHTPVKSFFKNHSLSLKASAKVNKQGRLKLQFEQKDAGFNSYGDPFHRRDYRQIDASLSQRFFKGKLNSIAFYKFFRNNIGQDTGPVNTLKGAGINISTAVPGWPVLVISHTPFEQTNNHSDSLFRTNNQFSTTSASLSYGKRLNKTNCTWMASYTRSVVEYYLADSRKALTSFYSVNQQTRSRLFSSSLNYLYSGTSPGIDSMNFQTLSFSLKKDIRKWTFGANGLGKTNASGGKMLGGGLTIERQVDSQLSVELNSGYKYFDGIWGLNKTIRHFTSLRVSYKLHKERLVLQPQ